MQSRLEDEEENDHSYHSSTGETDEFSVLLLPENTNIQSSIEMGQGPNEQQRELPAVMWPQYFATFAAVLGGMTMGTTIGNSSLDNYPETKKCNNFQALIL